MASEWEPRPGMAGEALVLEYARLPLPEERKASVGPALDDILALIDSLDSLELGDDPPETAFDARWG